MPDPDFQLSAEFYFPVEGTPSLDVQEVVKLIERSLPTAVIDFERGRQHVQANIDRLKSLGAPEIIYRGEYQLLDRTIYVEIPVPDRAEKLVGFTWGFSYLDGCLGLECTPFDMDVLKAGALIVARSLELDLSLESPDNLDIGILFKSGQLTPSELIEKQFSDLVSVSRVRRVTDDWQSRIESACVTWLNEHPAEQTANRWRSVVTDGYSLGHSLIHRLTSMGTVRKASIVDFDREFWHSCLALEYDDWSGLVNLSGLPQPLLEN
ncbi:hypothetical protein Enr10x_19660 [Gimesia panareensis]|uniref:Uncharacterized protein n=1 Tax=Gimesia panareensis TaxID=2527978 RepID=A0A517Q4V5_9PLAN|nr:hypothetical protein [Gimesia panareensis]QDT26656.1 hypothetical protein Enr10x_19660 [Gimesia panareensis]